MTDDEIRIAIAECCGYSVSQPMDDPATFRLEPMVGTRHYYDTEAEAWSAVPNYPTDLNAMHEAEKTLSVGQRRHYAHLLQLLVLFEGGDAKNPNIRHSPEGDFNDMDEEFACFTATASQRAEAFLRAKNLWREGD